jgi:hypothetical protein
LYSVATASLLATQHPFSALAAKKLSTAQFVCVSQFALLCSVPLLLLSSTTRRDVWLIVTDASNLGKLLLLFAIGLAGLVSYNFGLSNAHPVLGGASRSGHLSQSNPHLADHLFRMPGRGVLGGHDHRLESN